MRYLYCLIALFLIGCAKPQPPVSAPVVVDPALAPYLVSFNHDIGVNTDGISVGFADTSGNANPLGETVGECIVYSEGSTVVQRVIQIDPTYWATCNANERQQLVYHELGHCAMGLQHITGVDSNNCPLSIMYPYVFGGSNCYSSQMPYYFQELESHR